MKTRLILALLASAAAAPALAQMPPMPPPPSPDPMRAPAGDYVSEPYHTRVLFSILHMGFTNFYGEFPGASATLSYTPKNLSTMAVSVTIPVKSVSTGNSKLDGELVGAKWLDAGTYPTMTFKSTSVKREGKNGTAIMGDFTMHGVTKPLTLHATFVGGGINMMDKKETIGFQVSGHIKRSEYGVTMGVPMIGDDVTLMIAAPFEPK